MIGQLIKQYEDQLKRWESDQFTDDAAAQPYHDGRYYALSMVIQDLKKIEDIQTSPTPQLIITTSADEEETSFSLGETDLISTTYDEHGSSGQQAVERALTTMAEKLGVEIIYKDEGADE